MLVHTVASSSSLLLLSAALVHVTHSYESTTSSLPTMRAYQDGKTLRLPLNETATVELLDKWLSQAISGVIAAVATSRLDQLDSDEIEELQRCTKVAHTVPEHARCVVKILNVTKPIKRRKTSKGTKKKIIKRKRSRYQKVVKAKKSDEWVGKFRLARAKRSIKVVNRSSYTIRSNDDKPIYSKIIRQITKTVRTFKNKKGFESWRSTLQRIKTIGATARKQKEKRKEMKRRLRQMIANTPEEFVDPRKPLAIKEMRKALALPIFGQAICASQKMNTSLDSMDEMDMLDEAKSSKRNLTAQKGNEFRIPMKVLRESIKLFLAATGKNVTKFDKKTMKLVSPRLLSVVPEQDDDELFNLLSPSLFSLHEDGSEAEKAMSLPYLLKQLPNNDYEAWLDFIVEASGVIDTVDKTEKHFKEEQSEKDMLSADGVPLYLNKKNVSELLGSKEERKIETFEMLDKTYTPDQKDDLERQGFSFLNEKQLDIVYGSHSPYAKQDTLRAFQKLHRLRDDPHHLIERDIRAFAEAKKFQVRQKDIVLSPFVLTSLTFAGAALSQPVILSPLLLSPITLSPAVLGPIVLSPWVFVPLILSPRVLSPLILTPLMFSPIILSPLVLHPLILVPGIFNPIILSPLVLSPFILSPQVFSPLILTPMVLNPFILTPVAGTPLVLSPFLLSPIIYSPLFLSSVVLSPYVLSPLIESKLIASEVILSPSWLS